MKKSFSLLFILCSIFFFSQISEQKLDEVIQKTLTTFDVPGMSVGIIKDGKILYAKGFGVRSLNSKLPMTPETLVGIASNSKGFTCTALAILADEGKLDWDDKVTQFLPDFKMYEDYVTREITIKDLVTHRAGLGLGQGDLMFFPEGGNIKIDQLVHNVRYLKPEHSFRNNMDYNNIMFIVAGEIIHKVSGKSWAEFIEERIMKPVGMTASFGSYNRAKAIENKIDAHAPINGKAVAVPHDWNETANAAGGILSNINDMTTWANFLMNGFVTKDGRRLVSEKNAHMLWQIQQPIPMAAKNSYDTKFYGYGLGWFISDVKGHRQIQHSGGLIGTVTHFTMIPDMNLGIVVLTNQQSGAAFTTITNTVKDAYLGIEGRDWLKMLGDRNVQNNQQYEKEKTETFAKVEAYKKDKSAKLSPEHFLGTYHDAWFGNVDLVKENKGYRIICKSSGRLKGELLPYSKDTFVVKWEDRSYDADAFFTLTFDEKGKAVSAKMKPISDVTDFSFDFEDLDLKKVE